MPAADDQRADTLARHVADAADAWLRDPQDAGIYERLVHPALEGLEHAGRIDDPPRLAATLTEVTTELRRRAAGKDEDT